MYTCIQKKTLNNKTFKINNTKQTTHTNKYKAKRKINKKNTTTTENKKVRRTTTKLM